MKSQLASPTFTPTYAALIAIINTKFPEIGELLLKRVISQVSMHGSLCLVFLAHLHSRSLSIMQPKVSLMQHGRLFVVCTNKAWHDCAFLPVSVIAVLTVVAGQTSGPNTIVRLQFLKAFKRNDKGMAVGCLKFIAHLCNQQVAHEALALEIMVLLLETPTNDSVEIALEFARDVAALLEDTSPQSFTM